MYKALTIVAWIAIVCISVFLFRYIADHTDAPVDNVGWGIVKDNPVK